MRWVQGAAAASIHYGIDFPASTQVYENYKVSDFIFVSYQRI